MLGEGCWVHYYLQRNRRNLTAMRPIDLCFAHAGLVQWFTFESTKVYGGSGQWCSLDRGNCQTIVIGNLAASLTSVIIVFCNVCYVFGIIHTWALSVTEPHALCSVGKVILGLVFTVPAVFVIMHMRDGGTLPHQVPGLQVQVPSTPPIVLYRLMLRD